MIGSLDHLVLTTADEVGCVRFYTEILGMRHEQFSDGGTVRRQAFHYGSQKINLHVQGREFDPKARLPTPGSLDLCFLASVPLDQVIAGLEAAGVAIEVGPVARTGATGPIRSVYCRDPDGNLIEIAEPMSR